MLKRFKVPEALQAFEQDQELDPRTGILSGQDHFYFGRQEFCLEMFNQQCHEAEVITVFGVIEYELTAVFVIKVFVVLSMVLPE